MFSREDLRFAIAGIAEDKGLSLYDIDYPTVAAPTLRIYVWRMPGELTSNPTPAPEGEVSRKAAIVERRGVTLDECAQVSRAISQWLESSDVEGSDNWLLEVSSPGVNRRLRLKEHFESAVGERVKLKLKQELAPQVEINTEDYVGKRESIVGKIIEVGDTSLVLRQIDESLIKGRKLKRSPSVGAEKSVNVPLSYIEEGRVDFIF